MLPYCLLAHKSFPPSIIAKLQTITTIIYDDEPIATDVLDKITVAAASPMLGFDSQWFDKLPNLKLVALFGVGTDKVDLKEARKHGVDVATTLGILTEDVADMALTLLLATTRLVVKGDSFVHSHDWSAGKNFPLATSIRKKKMGVVGLGAIGEAIAKHGAAFDMTVSYYNRTEKPQHAWKYYNSVVELAKNSDFLMVAISATPQTHNIINAQVLEALGPQGTVINIARGAVIDEEALITALHQHKIASAGLDVYNNEPNIDERFLKLNNVVLMPHQGSATHETREAMGQCVIDNIAAVLAGKPALSVVNS